MGYQLQCWGECWKMYGESQNGIGYRHFLGYVTDGGQYNPRLFQPDLTGRKYAGTVDPSQMEASLNFGSGTITCPVCGYESLVKLGDLMRVGLKNGVAAIAIPGTVV